MSNNRVSGLAAYMWFIVVAAAPLVAYTAYAAWGVYANGITADRWLVVILFGGLIVAGEMRPIPVARGLASGDEITISTAFGFGLVLVCPVFTAIAAQALGLLVDCVVHRGLRGKLAFNIAQYALAYIASSEVYALISGRDFTPVEAPTSVSLGAALVAGGAFLLVNNLLVAIAVSLHVQLRLSRVLAGDFTWQISTSAPLIGLGPLAVEAMLWTPYAIVLLLMPVAALHHTGSMAMRREKEALRDSLTGLANRAMLTAAASRALTDSVKRTAMLLLDLDHFKDINDTLGHAVGDQMLIAVAERLRSEADDGAVIARLGGDEFVVLTNVADPSAAVELAERLCAAVRQAVVLHGVTLTVGCSIGIAFGPDHADDVSGLLRCADVALYNAKSTRGAVAVYDKLNDGHSAAQLGLQADLRSALESADDVQVSVAFQPQWDLARDAVTSFECLIRWHHPELGNVPPDLFIPIAENTSLIELLFDRVLNTALAQLGRWDAAGLQLAVSINLSARQLSDIALPHRVAECLTRHKVSAHRLVLEVTESRLLSNPDLSSHIVRDLTRLGVQISIDDFGTGYSSLAHLQRLAVHELKVDKSFVAQLDEPSNAAIVRSTIELGHNLGLRVVAEGVETHEAARQLAAMGCDVLQGFLLGEPMAAELVPALVASRRSPHLTVVSAGEDGDAAVLELVRTPRADVSPPLLEKAQ